VAALRRMWIHFWPIDAVLFDRTYALLHDHPYDPYGSYDFGPWTSGAASTCICGDDDPLGIGCIIKFNEASEVRVPYILRLFLVPPDFVSYRGCWKVLTCTWYLL
jgi:hypothetical protein